jgi:hypothetical protein
VNSDDTIPVAVGRTEPERTIDDGVADANQARKVNSLDLAGLRCSTGTTTGTKAA